jgi:poly-gamma-glutamate synthesis protein (capsule biosynthesis protein)
VLAIGHCGLEYVPFPPPYVVAAFRMLVDAGADCVIGHHPHVPQGIEWHRGRPIIYSLGNFVFYQNTDLYYRKIGFCLTLDLAGKSIAAIELHPYRITDGGLRRLDGGEERRFHQKMRRISTPFSKPAGPEKAWQAYLAYYGMHGFREEVLGILQKMETEPEKAAAMFHNRITTMHHVELWRDFLTRVIGGQRQSYSRAAYRIVEEWFTKRIQKPEARSQKKGEARS